MPRPDPQSLLPRAPSSSKRERGGEAMALRDREISWQRRSGGQQRNTQRRPSRDCSAARARGRREGEAAREREGRNPSREFRPPRPRRRRCTQRSSTTSTACSVSPCRWRRGGSDRGPGAAFVEPSPLLLQFSPQAQKRTTPCAAPRRALAAAQTGLSYDSRLAGSLEGIRAGAVAGERGRG